MIARRIARTTLLAALLVPAACAASPLRDRAGAWEVEVLVDGATVPTFGHAGETYVMGRLGERYTLRVHNRSGRRIEAVVSVDGRDVIDGKPAAVGKRGYLVPAWGSVDIDGWRISNREAAAFRFSRVADSYAARTGSARDVGVIGVAIFPERYIPPPPPPRPLYVPRPEPYGYNKGYDDYGSYGGRDADRAPSSGAGAGEAAPAPRASGPAEEAQGADEAYAYRNKKADRRPGLGTEYGEAVNSRVTEVEFVRASYSRPAATLGVRYNDRDGLIAMGVDIDGPYTSWDETHVRRTATPFPVSDRRYSTPPPGWNRY